MSSSWKLYDDPFTGWLKGRGTQVEVYQPAGFLGRPPVGRKITVGGSTLVYRIVEEAPHELIIVLLERNGVRRGLKSPFADIARFVTLVKRSGTPIRTIRGHVDVLARLPEDHTAADRIGAFYKRHLSATRQFVENGVEWVAGDLATYEPPLRSGRRILEED